MKNLGAARMRHEMLLKIGGECSRCDWAQRLLKENWYGLWIPVWGYPRAEEEDTREPRRRLAVNSLSGDHMLKGGSPARTTRLRPPPSVKLKAQVGTQKIWASASAE